MTVASPGSQPPFISQLRVLVFDLDGTLIDSNQDLAASVNVALRDLGRAVLSAKQVAGFVGDGVPALMRRALAATGGGNEGDLAAAQAVMLDHYQHHPLEATRLYPGVAELLPRLAARYALAVLTNKPVAAARQILRGLGIAPLLSAVYGGDSFADKKPNPAGLRAILGGRCEPAAALMVGDSIIDIQTGRAAGTWTCAVSYGFAPRDWRPGMADWEVAAFGEFAALLP